MAAFLGQNFSSLKQQAIANKKYFVDPEFPANDNSLSFTPGKMTGIVWKRPHDICMKPPQLFVKKSSCFGIHQGQLGNCWFVAACSALAMNTDILHKVIPEWRDQDWDEEHPGRYAGIFHCQFWRFGTWVDVVIDDLLPTRDNELVYTHSNTRNEFWCSLVEKAYAKLFGTYESLDGGELADVLEDFTGGVVENVQLLVDLYRGDTKKCAKLYEMLRQEFENKSLCAAYIPANAPVEMERSIDVGLVKGHAYPITSVKVIPIANTPLYMTYQKDNLNMVRLRIPWGKCEWSGPFSMSSQEFHSMDPSTRTSMGFEFEDKAEFWMRFEDFCAHFTNVLICRLINTPFVTLQKPWFMTLLREEWKNPDRAGGCVNYKDTYIDNPQYLFDLPDNEDEIIVSVMQELPRNTIITSSSNKKKVIGCTIVKVEENREYRIHRTQTVVFSSVFKPLRSVNSRLTLPRGRYIAIPTVFEPEVEGKFAFRLYTSAENKCRELTRHVPSSPAIAPAGCCGGGKKGGKNAAVVSRNPTLLTKIMVVKCTELQPDAKTSSGSDMEAYCIISNEGTTVKSVPCKVSATNPVFNTGALFFRTMPDNIPVTVEIMSGGESLGVHDFHSTTEVDHQALEVGLVDAHDVKSERPGRLHVIITHKRDLKSI